MSNKPNQTLTINYQADAPLKLDDVLYIVEIADSTPALCRKAARFTRRVVYAVASAS